MPFLSLGLTDSQDDKQDAVGVRPEDSVPNHHTHAEEATEATDHALPPEIEELRRKLSDKSAIRPKATSLAASVNALSSSERYGVPTFSTFKFGYVPARGLLYSSIGHEFA